MPITEDVSKRLVAQIPANEAVMDFHARHRFLGKILRAHAEVPAQEVENDIEQFFEKNPGATYPASNAIDLAASLIRSDLDDQTPRVVTVCRIVIVTLFTLIQLFVFGIIGIAAYKDLKVVT